MWFYFTSIDLLYYIIIIINLIFNYENKASIEDLHVSIEILIKLSAIKLIYISMLFPLTDTLNYTFKNYFFKNKIYKY